MPDHTDFEGKDVKGAAVIYLGANGPKTVDAQAYRRMLAGRSRHITERLHAVASIGPGSARQPQRPRARRVAPDDGPRLHDRATPRPADRPGGHRRRRLLRLRVQQGAVAAMHDLKRRAERPGAPAVVSAERRDADLHHRRRLRGRAHPAHPERRRDCRGHAIRRCGIRMWPSGPTTTTSATPKASRRPTKARRRDG